MNLPEYINIPEIYNQLNLNKHKTCTFSSFLLFIMMHLEQYFNQLILIHIIKTGHNNVNKWLFSNIHDTLQDSKWI